MTQGIIRNLAGRPDKSDPEWEPIYDGQEWDPGRGEAERASRREGAAK